jgi:hypothetical protein
MLPNLEERMPPLLCWDWQTQWSGVIPKPTVIAMPREPKGKIRAERGYKRDRIAIDLYPATLIDKTAITKPCPTCRAKYLIK